MVVVYVIGQIKMQVAVTYQTKHLISTAILATLYLITGEFSTDADPEGHHFNYIAFHVMRSLFGNLLVYYLFYDSWL